MKQIRNSSTKVSRIKLTIEEMNTIPAFLTPSEIKQYGFLVDTEFPKPRHCQHCHKELLHLGMRSLFAKSIFQWKENPERCDCEQSVRHWEEVDKAEIKAESDRLRKLDQEERMRRAKRLFDKSKMGERFKTRTFENFNVDHHNVKAFEAVQRYANDFKKYSGLGLGFMLSGPYGSGKTHLAAAVGIDLINKGVTVVFGTLISLLGKIRETYSDKWTQENELEILETFSTVDLLIIDDLGKERASEWSLEKLYSIVNARYENNLPIVITTNYSMETLIDKLTTNKNSDVGESIVSRLHEMCRGIYLDAPDHRKEKG